MNEPATGSRVRPLCPTDARGVALLVESYFTELGTKGGMSVEQTEQLFATPWLDGGAGFVLESGSELAGYGFVRPSRWKGMDCIQLGLTLKQGYRGREAYGMLTDQLLAAASEITRDRHLNNITTHLRAADTVHPPVMLELGFREHPVSMLGFRHDLAAIPARSIPSGHSLRPARLPEESAAVMGLMAAAFDDRPLQGEPIADDYLALVAERPGFDPEQVLLVERSGRPVGSAIVSASGDGGLGSYNILQLAVLPDSRRCGIGSALVCHALRWVKARAGDAVLAGVFSSNAASVLFWQLGFRPDPRRTFRFFLRDTDAPPAAQTGRQ